MMKTLIFILTISLSLSVSAQSVDRELVAVTGGSYSSGSLQVSYSVGESVIHTITGGNYTLSQGFQQTQAIGVGINDLYLFSGFTLFPNPVNNELNISFREIHQSTNLSIYIISMDGKIVMENISALKPGFEQSVTLDVSRLAAANYVLRIVNNMNDQSNHLVFEKIN